MNIRQEIKNNLAKADVIAKKRTQSYKARIKATIVENLEKGQKPQDQKVLAQRYYSAKQQPLNQMQQAMEAAL